MHLSKKMLLISSKKDNYRVLLKSYVKQGAGAIRHNCRIQALPVHHCAIDFGIKLISDINDKEANADNEIIAPIESSPFFYSSKIS